MRDLDVIDATILTNLRANARISHAQLGEMVRLSRNAVRQRIGRLERDGHICGYTIVERAQVSLANNCATLLVDRVDRMRGADVVTALRAIPEVIRCDIVAGELDLIVHIEAAEPSRVREIWKIMADHPGVRDITTAMSLNTVIDRRAAHGA